MMNEQALKDLIEQDKDEQREEQDEQECCGGDCSCPMKELCSGQDMLPS